jgi:hypothetical protein
MSRKANEMASAIFIVRKNNNKKPEKLNMCVSLNTCMLMFMEVIFTKA